MAPTTFLRVIALACVVAAASAAADRQLLNSNKNCTGLPTTQAGVVLGGVCSTLTGSSSTARGTTCTFTCIAPTLGAGGVYTCKDKKWRVTSGAACVVPSIKVDVDGSRKFGRTLELEVKVNPEASGTPIGAAVVTINGAIVSPFIVGTSTTNGKGKGEIQVPLTTANGFAASKTYGIEVVADVGLTVNNPRKLVSVTVRS